MMNRRCFLKSTVVAGTGALVLRGRAWPFAQSPTNLRKFVTSLPGLGPSGMNEIGQYIPLATKNTINFAGLATDTYNLAVAEFSERMHPDLPGKTHFFGYTDRSTLDQKYLAGAIVATRGTPVLLSVANLLPDCHVLPVDPTIMAGPNGLMVGDLPQNRIVTHLHGGRTPWFSDGTPFQWYTPCGKHGPSFMNVPGLQSAPGVGTFYYPNEQSARLVWYHDHAMDVTRLNQISRAVDDTVAFFGRLDILVNNAGGGFTNLAEDVPEKEFEETVALNLKGTFFASQAAGRVMIHQKRGRIINMSSVSGKIAVPLMAAYSSSKHAFEAFSDSLRYELYPFGVHVVLIEPGYIPTSMNQTAAELSSAYAKNAERSPYKAIYERFLRSWSKTRKGSRTTPEDCARAILRAVEETPPRARYVVTSEARNAILMRRFLPESVFDRGVRKKMGLEEIRKSIAREVGK